MRQGLITFKFDTAIELINAVKTLKVCIKEGQSGLGKQKDINYSLGRPLILKKGKWQFGSLEMGWATTRSSQSANIGSIGG